MFRGQGVEQFGETKKEFRPSTSVVAAVAVVVVLLVWNFGTMEIRVFPKTREGAPDLYEKSVGSLPSVDGCPKGPRCKDRQSFEIKPSANPLSKFWGSLRF